MDALFTRVTFAHGEIHLSRSTLRLPPPPANRAHFSRDTAPPSCLLYRLMKRANRLINPLPRSIHLVPHSPYLLLALFVANVNGQAQAS